MATKKKSKQKAQPIKGQQQRLPGTEDAAIQELETAAMEYADVRDRRMALSADEVSLKGELLTLLKKHKKDKYIHGDIEVELVHEKENVKVRIKKAKDESDED